MEAIVVLVQTYVLQTVDAVVEGVRQGVRREAQPLQAPVR